MFLLRIIIFIAIVIFTLPYIKKGADTIMNRIPEDLSNSLKKTAKEATEKVKKIKEQNK